MRELKITFLSVGNGDSIFLEFSDDDPRESLYGLIDCNDTADLKSTRIFLKRYFEVKYPDGRMPSFDFVMLSHTHADHSKGLLDIMNIYGTAIFYSAKKYNDVNSNIGGNAPIIKFIHDNDPPITIEKLNSNSNRISFGDAFITVLWPMNKDDYSNENNNSLIIKLEHRDNVFLFGGDAEYNVWRKKELRDEINSIDNIRVFKVPHHGAKSGAIHPDRSFTWDYIAKKSDYCVISSHVEPHSHPHDVVLKELEKIRSTKVLDTNICKDQNIEVCSDGKYLDVKYFNLV